MVVSFISRIRCSFSIKLLFSENSGSEAGHKIVSNARTCGDHLIQDSNGVFPGDPPDFECKFQNAKSTGI
jgi:hypothetical protein